VQTTSNKEKAVAILKCLESGDPSALLNYVSAEKYKQHNLDFPTGRDVCNQCVT
jgi:predicted SnoaL-like aldol condensation-catalyzing enzyme